MIRLVVKTLVFYKEQNKFLLLVLKRASHAGWCPGMEDLPGGKEVTIDPNEHSAFRWIDFKAVEQSDLHPRVKRDNPEKTETHSRAYHCQ